MKTTIKYQRFDAGKGGGATHGCPMIACHKLNRFDGSKGVTERTRSAIAITHDDGSITASLKGHCLTCKGIITWRAPWLDGTAAGILKRANT